VLSQIEVCIYGQPYRTSAVFDPGSPNCTCESCLPLMLLICCRFVAVPLDQLKQAGADLTAIEKNFKRITWKNFSSLSALQGPAAGEAPLVVAAV
jgi:hypothetical protein